MSVVVITVCVYVFVCLCSLGIDVLVKTLDKTNKKNVESGWLVC
jgi:hypothetical protein